MKQLAIALVLAAAAGCSIDLGSSTEGERGRAQFSYSGSCLFGCAIDHPVMAGASARISIQALEGKDLPEVNGQSSDPAVLAVTTEHGFSCCKSSSSESTCSSAKRGDTCPDGFTMTISQWMNVTAGRAGTARVSIVDAAGGLVDSIQIEVADAASATLKSGESTLDRVDLTVGTSATLQAELHDKSGRPLEASSGLRFTTSDITVASFDDPSFIFADPRGVATIERGGLFTSATLRGRKAGTATVQVSAGTFVRSFPVTVK